MTALRSVLFTRRARIIVPFLIVYGLGVYLVAGTVSTAFSGQGAQEDSDLVIASPLAAPESSDQAVDPTAVAEAVTAVEQTGALDALIGDQGVQVVDAGAWTADEANPAAPAPKQGVGVTLTLELPQATDIDLSTLPGAGRAERSLSGAASPIERGVTSLLVLYDPATDQIVAAHPVPSQAPSPPADLGPEPEVAQSDTTVDRDRPARRGRGTGSRRANEVRARG